MSNARTSRTNAAGGREVQTVEKSAVTTFTRGSWPLTSPVAEAIHVFFTFHDGKMTSLSKALKDAIKANQVSGLESQRFQAQGEGEMAWDSSMFFRFKFVSIPSSG